ncbi:MAG: nucleotidyltransferase family protein [bacterium]|nr:nucleotidyltransferase family protein [bacterium]
MDFYRVLQTLGRFLDQRETRYGVIGGVALGVYGIARLTVDLDLVIDREAQADLVTFFESLGYETLHCSDAYSNHLHPDSAMGGVDVVYVRGETERRIFEAARSLEGPNRLEILVPCPEHLAAMKVAAMKNDPDRTLQDLADIRNLMRLPGVDREAIREAFEKHGLRERYLELENDP